jgi:flavin reductase (DIM6/NTAB) family NADH-FMN oxidoreductase RutF
LSADAVLDLLVTSCVVVTSVDGEEPRGCLVASVMPVGFATNAVAFALTTGSRTQRAVARSGVAALHVLRDDDLTTARVFVEDADRFSAVPWSPGLLGVPVLVGAVGVLEMAVTSACEAGGCTVLCGEVVHAVSAGLRGGVLTINGIRDAGVERARTTGAGT